MIEAIWLTSLALLLAFTIVLIGQLLAETILHHKPPTKESNNAHHNKVYRQH